MYQEFFSLKEQPFSISPDPDFLFLSDRHKEALAHLKYGLQGNGGFVLLTGEVGTGKTTVCRFLLQEMPQEVDVAFILNPALTEIELLASICDEFKIEYQQDKISLKLLFDSLTSWMMNNHLQGRSAIVLIDEAQHLSFSVLEQLRLLTNIESNNKKPLQVILIGQTELQQKLKQTELRQLAQRITARYHLLALTEKETAYYIQHRLNIAGAVYPLFEPGLLRKIFKCSQGIPRLINLICDRCLLCAYSENAAKISPRMLKLAVKELDLGNPIHNQVAPLKRWWRLSFLAALLLIVGWQSPQILNNLFTSVLAEKVSTVTTALVPAGTAKKESVAQAISNEEIQEEAPDLQRESVWFDDYPQLDLTQGEFTHALQTLYAVWGYQLKRSDANCEQGAAVLLICFSESSNISKLKQLNYPAVIKLENAEQYIYLVVYKVADSYQLLIGEQSINVSAAWLQRYWHGGLTLLWKAPFIADKTLKFGQKSKQVAWLNRQFNNIYAQPESNNPRFDLPLVQKVKQFQRAHFLIDDGIVGVRTLMALMQQTDPQLPRLSEED